MFTYPGIPAVQDLIGGPPGGTAGHTRIQPVADLSAAAAVKQHFSLPFLQPLGQASVVTSSPPGTDFSSLAELCVPTFPHVDRDGQDEHELQMLHGFKKIIKLKLKLKKKMEQKDTIYALCFPKEIC